MRDFVVPRNVQPSVAEALREIRIILRDMGVPFLENRESLKQLSDGASAYFLDGKHLFRYTKKKGRLFREEIGEHAVPAGIIAPPTTETTDTNITFSSRLRGPDTP